MILGAADQRLSVNGLFTFDTNVNRKNITSGYGPLLRTPLAKDIAMWTQTHVGGKNEDSYGASLSQWPQFNVAGIMAVLTGLRPSL